MSKSACLSSHKVPRCLCTGENRWKQPPTCPEVKCWKMKEEPPSFHYSLDKTVSRWLWTNFTEMANPERTCHPCCNTAVSQPDRNMDTANITAQAQSTRRRWGQPGPGWAWLSWPSCPFSFQSVDCHKKVSHGHQEYRTDLRSVCDTQPMTATKQAWSGACLIFVVRKVSTKKSRKKSWQAAEKGRVQVPGLPQSFCVTLVELFIPCTPEQ